MRTETELLDKLWEERSAIFEDAKNISDDKQCWKKVLKIAGQIPTNSRYLITIKIGPAVFKIPSRVFISPEQKYKELRRELKNNILEAYKSISLPTYRGPTSNEVPVGVWPARLKKRNCPSKPWWERFYEHEGNILHRQGKAFGVNDIPTDGPWIEPKPVTILERYDGYRDTVIKNGFYAKDLGPIRVIWARMSGGEESFFNSKLVERALGAAKQTQEQSLFGMVTHAEDNSCLLSISEKRNIRKIKALVFGLFRYEKHYLLNG